MTKMRKLVSRSKLAFSFLGFQSGVPFTIAHGTLMLWLRFEHNPISVFLCLKGNNNQIPDLVILQ